MKKIALAIFFTIFAGSCVFLSASGQTAAGKNDDPLACFRGMSKCPDLALDGTWVSFLSYGTENLLLEKASSRTFFVHSSTVPKTAGRVSYGGALDLKYYSGISYDYLQKNLPGKTISVKVNIPKEAISSNSVVPNRLQAVVKSDTNGEWADYYGDTDWLAVKKEGSYELKLTVPEKPVTTRTGNTLQPANTALFAVDYNLLEGTKQHEHLTYTLSDFAIEGIGLDARDLKWQFTKDGLVMQDSFLKSFPGGSTFIYAMGAGLDLELKDISLPARPEGKASGNLEGFFIATSVFIPEELKYQKGTVALTITTENGGAVRSSVKNFFSANLEGKIDLSLPLDPFTVDKNVSDLANILKVTFKIKTEELHDISMMPIVIEPILVKQGRLIPFDAGWRLRTAPDKYLPLEIRKDNAAGKNGIAAQAVGSDNYQLDAVARLQGGINWNSPYYRIELVRQLSKTALDLGNMHLEVKVNPITDTTELWQKPYRARLGLLDIDNNVMFGPNISLSEGLGNIAQLDVSLTNPISKGFVSPGFDPKKVKAVIINLEAPHVLLEPEDVQLSFVDLVVTPREYARMSQFKLIDFSRFKREPENWVLTGLIKDSGGFTAGLNYPFPVIDIAEGILKVPEIYPCVGMKPSDPQHLGFGSVITGPAVMKDLRTFAKNGIDIVRIITMGHLDGIFTWDERGKDIADFAEGREAVIREAAGLSVEKFAEFLNANEETFFPADAEGAFLGIEKHVITDFLALLDMLEKTEKETGRRILAVISLYDFLLGDGITAEGPRRVYNVGEHPEIVNDSLIKIKAEALLWKIMKTLSRDERFYRYIAVVEIMNEPENAAALSTREGFGDLLSFIGENLYLLKDALGPKMPVSVGFRSWPPDLRYWAPIAGGIDILLPHYWKSFESYDIDAPGLWPLDTPVKELWKYLGASPEGRPAGIGEIGPLGNIKENLFRIEKGGYDLALVWSYSGHDGYDAKPFMNAIGEYQEGSILFAELKKTDPAYLKKAFLYAAAARIVFDNERPVGAETLSFNDYLKSRLLIIRNENLIAPVEKILKIAELKGFALTPSNIRVLIRRSSE